MYCKISVNLYYAKLEIIFNKHISLFCCLFRYESSEPVNVTVLEGIPTFLNFTLSRREISDEQGNIDIDYPQISFFNKLLTPYEMIIDYNKQIYK